MPARRWLAMYWKRSRAADGGVSLTVAFDRADCNGERSAPVAFALVGMIDRVDEEESMEIRGPSGLFGRIMERPPPEGPGVGDIVEQPRGTQRSSHTDFSGATRQNPLLQSSI